MHRSGPYSEVPPKKVFAWELLAIFSRSRQPIGTGVWNNQQSPPTEAATGGPRNGLPHFLHVSEIPNEILLHNCRFFILHPANNSCMPSSLCYCISIIIYNKSVWSVFQNVLPTPKFSLSSVLKIFPSIFPPRRLCMVRWVTRGLVTIIIIPVA